MKGYISRFFKIGRLLLLAICVSVIGISIVGSKVKAAAPENVTFYRAVQSPILSAVAVPANRAYVWTSGTVPPVINPKALEGTRDRYGDTKTQGIGIIQQFQTLLQEAGLSLANIIYLRVYIVHRA